MTEKEKSYDHINRCRKINLKKEKHNKPGVELCIRGKKIRIPDASGDEGKETFGCDGYVHTLIMMTISQVHSYAKIYQIVDFMYIYYMSILSQ